MGRRFSTRAESNANRQLGFDVIGMTNLPEAKLAREAEIALATLAMITDYDCWKVEEEPVNAQTVIGHLTANAAAAKAILAAAIPQHPAGAGLAGARGAGHGAGDRARAVAGGDGGAVAARFWEIRL